MFQSKADHRPLTRSMFLAVAAAAIALVAIPVPAADAAQNDIVDTAVAAGTVENLLKPENKARLASILIYHVVAGNVKAADVVKLKEAKTVNGQSVKIVVEAGKVKVDGANVVTTDVAASNGTIHVIDAVILPK